MSTPNDSPSTSFLPEGLQTALRLGVRGTLALGAIGFVGWATVGGGAESIGADVYNAWHNADSYQPEGHVPSTEAGAIHAAQQTIDHNKLSHDLSLNGENPDQP